MGGVKTNSPEPEWQKEKWVTANFGLGHTTLYNLRRAGEIRSVSVKREGEKYGSRLFHVESIRAFIARQEAAEEEVEA